MKKATLSTSERIALIQSVGEDIVGLDELLSLLESDEDLVCYDGMEPSGRLHIAQGTMRAINTNKMIKAGFCFKFYVADWFAFLNNKLEGDLEKIHTAGEYFIEIWRSCGMDLGGVEFVWASELIKQDGYWELVMKTANNSTLKRILRCTQIMGRNEEEKLLASQILYPCMQATDIFMLKAQVAQLGMDQRKVNMLARTISEEIGMKKPIIVSNHMLMGLLKSNGNIADPIEKAISMKMSKSKPDSAIFMDDPKEEIHRKIMKAYCPEGIIELNPILEYCKYIIFESAHLKGREELLKNGFHIKRLEKFGGDVVYKTYEELEKDYSEKKLYPLDLKVAVIEYLNSLLEPVRKHFESNADAASLMEAVNGYNITR